MLDGQSIQGSNLSDSPLGWWAVYTRHQHEKVVADMLTAKGLEVFLPLCETLRQWKDRSKKLLMPLFPCYLFVREQEGTRLQIVSTPGTHMILTRGEALAVIPTEEIQAIRQAAQDPARVEPHPFLQCGERVRVQRGPMEGVEGILVRRKNQCRLILSVEMIAQAVAVEVDANDVEPLAWQDLPRLNSSAILSKQPIALAAHVSPGF